MPLAYSFLNQVRVGYPIAGNNLELVAFSLLRQKGKSSLGKEVHGPQEPRDIKSWWLSSIQQCMSEKTPLGRGIDSLAVFLGIVTL